MRRFCVPFTARRLMAVIAIVLSVPTGCGEEYGDPESVFEVTFGAPPGPRVSILQAYGRVYDDSTCYLRFEASPAAFSSLTAGFTPITREEYRDEGLSGPIPSWWKPLKDAPTIFLNSESFHPRFSLGKAIVAYNPELQIANFYWNGSE
jgi:hypothetical protein